MSKDTASFGYQDIPRLEKTGRVKDIFERVAPRYDLMNDLMSAGLHRLWKREFVAGLSLRDGMQVLDLAGGTGDIAFRMGDKVRVTVCDINPAMLEEGRARAIDRNTLTGIEWTCGNAESLPFSDQSFDRVTIAFGIRNVTDIPAALKEAYRVLKPGGMFACLEFSRVKQPALAKLYDAYSFQIVPKIGEKIIGDAQPYQYLVESIRRFPDQETFARMIREAGFSQVNYRNLSAGIVAIHKGYRT